MVTKSQAAAGGRKARTKRRASEESQQYQKLVENTNILLSTVLGIKDKKFKNLNELTRVASSMFVAIYEGFFGVKISGVIRKPKTVEDSEINAQRVIDALQGQIQMNLAHIRGINVAKGHLETLANLVNIFMFTCNPVNTQMDEADNSDRERNDQDSISTHESTFEQGHDGPISNDERDNVAKMLSLENQMFNMSNDKVQKLCEEDARQVMRSTEAKIHQEGRIDSARRRRDEQRMKQESRLGRENKRKKAIARQMQQARWLEENQRESQAHAVRQSSEEHAMLRKIYGGLLSKLHTWRRAERQEARERVNRMRDDAKNNVEQLQNLFDDRLNLLKEQNANSTRDDNIYKRSHIQVDSDLLQSYSSRQKKMLETYKGVLSQKRQQQLLKRSEARKNLIALLSVEKWQDGLRTPERPMSAPMPRASGDFKF